MPGNPFEEAFKLYSSGDREGARKRMEGSMRRDAAYIQMIASVDGISIKDARKKAAAIMHRSEKVRKDIGKYYHDALQEYYERSKRPGRMMIIEEVPLKKPGAAPVPVTGVSELERLRQENAELKDTIKNLTGVINGLRNQVQRLAKSLEEKK